MKKTMFTILSCLMLIPFASAMHHEASGHKISEAEVIKIAKSAAPANISGDATIMSSDGTILVEGTNGWTCMPCFINTHWIYIFIRRSAWHTSPTISSFN